MGRNFKLGKMTLPDKHIIGERFWKNKETYKQEATVQKVLCECFAGTLQSYSFPLCNVFEIGCGTGFLTQELCSIPSIQKLYVNDVSPKMQQDIDAIIAQSKISDYVFIAGDAETIDFPSSIDAIVSTSTLQWFHSISSFFDKAALSLPSQGILAFSTFGPNNFIEIKQTLGKGLDYLSLNKLLEYVQKQFIIIDFHEWEEQLWFNSPIEILQHIKHTGVSGFGSSYFGRQKLQEFSAVYSSLYSNNNKVRLTYHPIMVFAQKK
ncbi:MAG TPA: methyltransferase domain-containing protein [Bacteroidales bacterium]|nr:methyltransferase domain-containing protein [Bacteroidales bacterium]